MHEVIEQLNTMVNALQNQINFISPSYLCESPIFHLEFFVDGRAVLIQLYFFPLFITHYLPHKAPFFAIIHRAGFWVWLVFCLFVFGFFS